MADVYELAERLRQRHGGTAVVLGALSPRTRNAQVAMYEAGEVQHMVATDAIGMGLNLDLDRVVFASAHKYDGKEIRPLQTAELAQIAGRAGRFTRDGGFGTLRPLPGLAPRQVEAIERHTFRTLKAVVWRNGDLDFSSVGALIDALRERPRRAVLKMIEQADDFEGAAAAVALGCRPRAGALRGGLVRLLWDVCRIPDFRKLLLDSHIQLLARIYEQLSRSPGTARRGLDGGPCGSARRHQRGHRRAHEPHRVHPDVDVHQPSGGLGAAGGTLAGAGRGRSRTG